MIKAISIYPSGDTEEFIKESRKLWEFIKKEVDKSFIYKIEIEHELIEITDEPLRVVDLLPSGIININIKIKEI